jgi:HD-GYP domain-containing protein (c-di-GMP phosphodiesterase class II)
MANSMSSKIPSHELKVGMFVADLDRPWVDTPFLLQGFLIEDDEQLRELQAHCEFVIVDRARSVGDQFVAPPASAQAASRSPIPMQAPSSQPAPGKDNAPPRADATRDSPAVHAVADGKPRYVIRYDESAKRAAMSAPGAVVDASAPRPGLIERLFGGLLGRRGHARDEPPPVEALVAPVESAQEFESRTSLLPPGTMAQSYRDSVTVEQEVPRARAVVTQASDLLEKLVNDIRLGQSFEVDRVEEIVDDMVESIVRNPDALMWLARMREQDITTYGHGLQVSVYLTAFGRHLGFPKHDLALLAQVGLLLDIGKIRLPKNLLEKQGRLTAEEFETAKQHVRHSMEILAQTPNFDPQVLAGIEQHHERMNGSGYPNGLEGLDIGIFGRMAGIVDTFAALTNHRPYADALSSYEALRNITGWAGDYFHEPLVQQFVSSVGVFPVGSLIELSSGEVAVVVAHNKVRRLKPRVLVVTAPDKTRVDFPVMIDLLYDPKRGGETAAFIKRGLPAGAYGLDLSDYYLG